MLTHAIFAKMMVDVISSICDPSFIFYFYDVDPQPFTSVAFLGGGDTVLAQFAW